MPLRSQIGVGPSRRSVVIGRIAVRMYEAPARHKPGVDLGSRLPRARAGRRPVGDNLRAVPGVHIGHTTGRTGRTSAPRLKFVYGRAGEDPVRRLGPIERLRAIV